MCAGRIRYGEYVMLKMENYELDRERIVLAAALPSHLAPRLLGQWRHGQ